MHPIGREIGDIPAVPTDDGPNMFSVELNPEGASPICERAEMMASSSGPGSFPKIRVMWSWSVVTGLAER